MQKNETGPLSYTIHKNKLKMDERTNVRPETIKLLKENISSNSWTLALATYLWICPSIKGNKSKNKQLGLHQNKKPLHSKGNNQQNKKAPYRMGEGICKSFIQ